jgi:hypothetical protein
MPRTDTTHSEGVNPQHSISNLSDEGSVSPAHEQTRQWRSYTLWANNMRTSLWVY